MLASELRFERDGAEIISGAVSLLETESVQRAFEQVEAGRPGRGSFGSDPAVADMVGSEGGLGTLAQRFAGSGEIMRPVRVVLFDKTPESNWAVAWHQDRTIAVAQRHEVDGFRNWNRKDGIDHVEPPIELLSRMVTLRLHLDDAGEDNGALYVVPGSHRLGRVAEGEMIAAIESAPEVCCPCLRGDILAMRLTTIHKSECAVAPKRRRVLHVDYSPDYLPGRLQWAMDAPVRDQSK